MDRVIDNLDWFWRTVLDNSGKSCAWEMPRSNWIPIDGFAIGPCGAANDSTAASYCGNGGFEIAGEITVGERWMFNDVYQRFHDHAEFAVASVLAHEMGHHMQDVFGISGDTHSPAVLGWFAALNIEPHADCLWWWSGYRTIYGCREIDPVTVAPGS